MILASACLALKLLVVSRVKRRYCSAMAAEANAMPPRKRRRCGALAAAAMGSQDIRVALMQGAKSTSERATPYSFTPCQEAALADWEPNILRDVCAAWLGPSQPLSPLLLQANWALIPVGVLRTFALPEEATEEACEDVRGMLRLAQSWWQLQRQTLADTGAHDVE